MSELNNNNIEKRVIDIVAKRLGVAPASITKDSYLFDDLNSSKLEVADIIQTLEDAFQLKFNIAEVKSFEKIEDIIDYIADNAE